MKRSLSPQRLAHRSQDSRANPVVDSVGSPIPLPPARRLKKNAGLSLIEVTFAMALFTMICLGVLQAMLQSRRMTEGSVRQASIASLVQGYMEQFKSIKFAADTSNALPSSSTASPGSTAADWESYTGAPSGIPPILPAKGADQAIEHIAHLLDLVGHAQIGDAQLAQRAVHVAEEQVDEGLAELARRRLALEATEQQREVQRNHVEAAGDRVRNAPVGVELLLPGLRHNGPIGLEGSVGGRGFTEKLEYHGHAPRHLRPGRFAKPACQPAHLAVKQTGARPEAAS